MYLRVGWRNIMRTFEDYILANSHHHYHYHHYLDNYHFLSACSMPGNMLNDYGIFSFNPYNKPRKWQLIVLSFYRWRKGWELRSWAWKAWVAWSRMYEEKYGGTHVWRPVSLTQQDILIKFQFEHLSNCGSSLNETWKWMSIVWNGQEDPWTPSMSAVVS